MIKTAILGATGYTGVELIRLLRGHPEAEINTLYSRSLAGSRIGRAHPGFLDDLPMECRDLEAIDHERVMAENDLIFCALPHGVSMGVVDSLFAHSTNFETRIIDLSADFRYDDPELYNRWYETEHSALEVNRSAVYGLPELFREEIRGSRLVANPGCYPTVSILGLAPLLGEELIREAGLIIDAKSGVSGAGRSPSTATHFSEVHNNFRAYSVAIHRHGSEIREKLSSLAGLEVGLSFVPHLVPMQRGILATIYADPGPHLTGGDERGVTGRLLDCYRSFYRDEPFITIYPEDILPGTRDVHGTNRCGLTVRYDPDSERVIIIGVIDNLCRGASGQAVQNMNLLFGLDESLGLKGSFVL